MTMTDQQRVRTFLSESQGDLGLAILRLFERVEALERKCAAHVAELDQAKADAAKAARKR